MPELGALLGAKYRVLAKLGEGGMGTVFRAENELTGKHVAIKWMHPHLAANPDAAERMLREARAASKLSHPNVVDVYDVVRDDNTLFLVMELLQGETLREYLRHNPHPKLSEFISLLLGAMAGVAAAHEHGVIHRDLKPDNIFLERIPGIALPTTKVVDFGIAKLAEIRGSTLTETGAAIGTPVYMSLEQLRGDKDIDARTDVYAFGVMLYEAVVGRMPYNAATLPELAIKVATTDALAVHSLRPDVPPALATLIDRAIARDRTRRLPDVRTLMDGLTPFASGASLLGQPSQASSQTRGSGWPIPSRNTPMSQRPWDATQALPEGTSPVLATRQGSHEVARTDSLTGRELNHTRTQPSHSRPVWIAAAAFFSVSTLAAYLLLGDASKSERLGVETSVDGVRETPKQIMVGPIRPSPPVIPEPEIPALSAKTGEELRLAEGVETESPHPVDTTEPLRQAPPKHDAEHRPERPRTQRPSRQRAQLERPLPSLPSDRPERADRPEPAPKQKNAADVLGF